VEAPVDVREAEWRNKHLAKLDKADWIIPADLDEFHQFPYSLDECIDRLTGNAPNYVYGSFVDRVAADGSLATISPSPSIFAQFPMEADISLKVAKATVDKVILCRSTFHLSGGHHRPAVDGAIKLEQTGYVHHFKWHGALLEHLQRRVAKYREMKEAWWWVESQRILDYFARRATFDLEAFEARPSWIPYE